MAIETSMKLTCKDYFAIPDDGRRHEIIDGVHYASPSPSFKHQCVITVLIATLGTYVHARDAGSVVSYVAVIPDEHTLVLPDVLFISKARMYIVSEYVHRAPDLVIEVLSSNRDYDERVKYQEYERSGVLEYWIIDPEAESVRVFRRAGAKFAPVPVTGVITTPLLPDFAVRVADLFA